MTLTKKINFMAMTLLSSQFAMAAAPQNYYQSVNTSNAVSLKQSLHAIIDDHKKIPYTSSNTDTWDVLELADQNPDNETQVIDVYKNAVYAKEGGGNSFYNREHSWPKSYGFPKDGSTNYPYTDLHHLFIANSSYNSSRNNKIYGACNDAACIVKTTDYNNGRGGSAVEVNLTLGSGTTGSWQTWPGRRGDVARALMYLAVRYEGDVHSITGVQEPDLELTNDTNLIEASKTGGNELIAYMGLKSTLIAWHKEDPVDQLEQQRNDAIFLHQGNRNPFIDHPEYIACIFEQQCSGIAPVDTTAPQAPTGLVGSAQGGTISLTWNANDESDIASYNVYRQTDSAPELVTNTATTSFTDSNVASGQTYSYSVSAIDRSDNESLLSDVISVSLPNQTEQQTWINEFHYDNESTDKNEGVEVAGSAGVDLSGWQLLAYNGNNGQVYKSIQLSGVIADQANGFGTIFFAVSGLQNGSADGLALVNAQNQVIQFISYEGELVATNGAAQGLRSSDIGTSESSSTLVGHSLQLVGDGTRYSDFTWQLQSATENNINTGQSFGGVTPIEAHYFENVNQLAIPDNGQIESLINVERSGLAADITINVDITHTYRGDISLVLIAPSGEQVTLKDKNGRDGTDNLVEAYSVQLNSVAKGEWKLRVADNYRQDIGSLNRWSIDFSK